ncbi:DoxX-like protein [Haloactinospora alba]|uniref:DoxX-like protein n=1 Tax=Haloactinospora alba TaxID=405555 RepID=A0A543NNP7_9ACTN|nr:DoxX family protein [Haloactinospora alba]TQN33453.1 DoxX-like protein [Haloactinospora alba]
MRAQQEEAATAAASSQETSRQGRAANIALWVVQGLLAAGFAFAGGSKLAGVPAMVETFDTIGLGQWLRYLTGALEVAGAVGLLIPLLSGLAALGLAAVMVGAAIADVALLGQPPFAALALLVLSAVAAWGRRDRTASLAARLRGERG